MRETLKKILILDDEITSGQYIAEAAKEFHCHCSLTTNSNDFFSELNRDIHTIFLDLMLPEIDGIEILRILKERHCVSNIILISEVNKRILEISDDFARSLNLSVVGHLQKPFVQEEVKKLLSLALSSVERVDKSLDFKKSEITFNKKELELAIKKDEFVVHYQPQFDIKTRKLSGFEALARWQHPNYGLIMPDRFIGLSESLGLIDEIGWVVAEKGLKEISKIIYEVDKKRLSKDKRKLSLSLNVSPYTLMDIKFPDKMMKLITEQALHPDNVVIEITESGLFKELSNALDVLARLGMKGIRLSIDDFGTGYSMLEQLRRVPATELKIDKSFIRDMSSKESAQIMVLKIIEIAHALEMKVLAEGVETEEQLLFLINNQCDLAQGYLFSRPIPLESLKYWVRNF